MSNEENDLNTQEEEEQVVDFEEEEQEFEDQSELSYSKDDDNYCSLYFREINICRALYLEFNFPETTGNTISFRIPTNILPLTVQLINGFYNNPYLAECTFELNQNNPWRSLPNPYQITNSTYGRSFPGSILIQNRINHFFSPDFKPQPRYRCQSYVLAPQTNTKPSNLQELVSKLTGEGFSDKQSLKALQFCSYDLDKARDYLITGSSMPVITLPKKLQVYGDKFRGFQFLVTFVSPESELRFLERKKEFGVQ